LVIGERGMRVNLVALGCLRIEMIDQGRAVLNMGDARFRSREMRKIIVHRQILFGFQQGRQDFLAQSHFGDPLDLAVNFHARVPDFERRLGGEFEDEFAIGFRSGPGKVAGLFVRHVCVESGNRDAGREPFQVHREIDAGQGLVEVVDVE
jgi:hypothetical protein